jgi:hypothetical protein
MFGHATQENKLLLECPAYSLNPSFPITHWPTQRSPDSWRIAPKVLLPEEGGKESGIDTLCQK